MNRRGRRGRRGAGEDSRGDTPSVLCDKIWLLLSSAGEGDGGGKCCDAERVESLDSFPVAVLTAELGDRKESAAEGCCQAAPELRLTRSRDELHHNTLRGNEKRARGGGPGEG